VIPRSAVAVVRTIGNGEFGEVCHAKAEINGQQVDTAVKMLRRGSKPGEKVEFLKEAAIMAQFNHDNVIM